jgi:hypothetical protein
MTATLASASRCTPYWAETIALVPAWVRVACVALALLVATTDTQTHVLRAGTLLSDLMANPLILLSGVRTVRRDGTLSECPQPEGGDA